MYSRWIGLLAALTASACCIGGFATQDTTDPGTWPIVYQDDFNDPTSGWGVGETETVTRSYSDGAYRIEVTDDLRLGWSRMPGGEEILDFVVEVSVQRFEGQGHFGIVFWYEDGD
jgi:hypothetical protein